MKDNPFEKIPHELWLMLACSCGDIDKTQNLLLRPVNWDYLLQLALHHRVYPLVYKTLCQVNNAAVPGIVLSYLRQRYQENTMQALTMTGETVRMVNCFENQGIRAVVLKGAPLAWRLYGDVAVRPSKDIDILIPPNELEKVQGVLENEGYRKIEIEYPERNYTSRQLQILTRSFHHDFHVSYLHNSKNVFIEVHWRLGNSIHELSFPNASNITAIGVAGSLLPVLSDEDWLLYLMLHGAVHAWFRLRWLVDIAKFTQQESIDWGKMLFMAKSIGMQPIFHQSLILANELLDAHVPPHLLSVAVQDRSALLLSNLALNICLSKAEYEINGPEGNSTGHWQRAYNFYVRKEWKKRFHYLLKVLFSPTVNDIKIISLPDKLFGLYYVIRPFSFLYYRSRKIRAGN